MDFFINHHGWGQSAGAHTGYRLQRILAVRRSFSSFNTQDTFQFRPHPYAAAHVAGGTPANADNFLALGSQLELGIKGTDAVDGGRWDIQAAGNFLDRGFRDIMKGFLRFLQNRYELFPVSGMAAENFLKSFLFCGG